MLSTCAVCGAVQRPGPKCLACNAVLERPDLSLAEERAQPAPAVAVGMEIGIDRRKRPRDEPAAAVAPAPVAEAVPARPASSPGTSMNLDKRDLLEDLLRNERDIDLRRRAYRELATLLHQAKRTQEAWDLLMRAAVELPDDEGFQKALTKLAAPLGRQAELAAFEASRAARTTLPPTPAAPAVEPSAPETPTARAESVSTATTDPAGVASPVALPPEPPPAPALVSPTARTVLDAPPPVAPPVERATAATARTVDVVLSETAEMPSVAALADPPPPMPPAAAVAAVPPPAVESPVAMAESPIPPAARPSSDEVKAAAAAAVAARKAQGPVDGVEVIRASPAPIGVRVGAWLVDGVVLALFGLAYLKVAQMLMVHPPAPTAETGLDWFVNRVDAYGVVLRYGAGLCAALAFVYSSLFHALGGRTLGKRLFGVQLVDATGRAPSLGRCALRSLLSLASAAFLFLGFFLALFDRRRQALHDKLSGTWVVRPA